jgi:uncharacterized protein (DUF2267 family)
MGYRELIKKVQIYSGFSDRESKEALDHTVEVLAAHLTDDERKDFASQLPQELQNVALSAEMIQDRSQKDVLRRFMETQGMEESRAKKQVLSAWRALKETISQGEIEHIKTQLPDSSAAMLH